MKREKFKRIWVISLLALILVSCTFSISLGKECNDGEHGYTITIEEYPTATESGTRLYVCDLCGKTFTESIAPTGHDFKVKIIEPTESESGKRIYTCTKCGYTYTETFLRTGGTEGEEVATEGETQGGALSTPAVAESRSQTESKEKVSITIPSKGIAGKKNAFEAIDALILGANGISLIFFIILLLPYIKVILWVKRKKKEALEEER